VALGSVSTGALSSNMKKSILSIIKEMVDYTITMKPLSAFDAKRPASLETNI
jgi:hypothetical protein